MPTLADALKEDIRKINQISIVPSMLEIICRATGMGFAAIARVTEDRWIACSVRDEINFGLQPGGELPIETTICNEIRQSKIGVIIDHVDAHDHFCTHPTPKMYGFQSYISIPIILSSGEFFGTLCAIDPKPMAVSDFKISGMFTLFAQLIAFHLQTVDSLEASKAHIEATDEQLSVARKENERYVHLTYHSLREPVRKICLSTDILVQAGADSDLEKVREIATNINRYSLDLAGMLKQMGS